MRGEGREGGGEGRVPANLAAETEFPVTSGREWRALKRTREDSAILGFERDPADSQRSGFGTTSAYFTRSRGSDFWGLWLLIFPSLLSFFLRAQKTHYSLSWLVGWFGEVGSQRFI